jgi:hypothetical protein
VDVTDRRLGLLAAALVGLVGAGAAVGARAESASPSSTRGWHAYPDQPPLAYTGGFGEPTCRSCHFDESLNDAGGTLTLAGLPERFAAGGRYVLTVSLVRPGIGRAGFELSTRFAGDAAPGRPAGTLRALDERSAVRAHEGTGVQYAHHTRAGIALLAPDTARWLVEWTAPGDTAEAVVVHVSANAANGDASELGDFIYTARRVTGCRRQAGC